MLRCGVILRQWRCLGSRTSDLHEDSMSRCLDRMLHPVSTSVHNPPKESKEVTISRSPRKAWVGDVTQQDAAEMHPHFNDAVDDRQ